MATTTSIFRLNFESYPELRTELRTKAVSRVFDQMSVTDRDGTDSCKLTRATWIKDTLAEWDEVDADYVPEEHAALVQMTDAQRARKIVAFEKRATAGAAAKAGRQGRQAVGQDGGHGGQAVGQDGGHGGQAVGQDGGLWRPSSWPRRRPRRPSSWPRRRPRRPRTAEKEELKAARAVVKAEAKAI